MFGFGLSSVGSDHLLECLLVLGLGAEQLVCFLFFIRALAEDEEGMVDTLSKPESVGSVLDSLHEHCQNRRVIRHCFALLVELDETSFRSIFEVFVYLSFRPGKVQYLQVDLVSGMLHGYSPSLAGDRQSDDRRDLAWFFRVATGRIRECIEPR